MATEFEKMLKACVFNIESEIDNLKEKLVNIDDSIEKDIIVIAKKVLRKIKIRNFFFGILNKKWKKDITKLEMIISSPKESHVFEKVKLAKEKAIKKATERLTDIKEKINALMEEIKKS